MGLSGSVRKGSGYGDRGGNDLLDARGEPNPGYAAPGAVKEQLRRRRFQTPPKRRLRPPPYAELHAASSFSFLRASSQPEDLVARAAALGLPAVALVDRNGVSGAPRFYKAAREAGIRALVGAEAVIDRPQASAVSRQREERPTLDDQETRVNLLVRSRQGYRNLCRLLTAGALSHPKGEARIDWTLLEEHAEGLHCLAGAETDPVGRALAREGLEAAGRQLERLHAVFPGRLHVELSRHGIRADEHRNQALVRLADRLRVPVVATGGVRYAAARDKPLHDLMTAIRHHVTVDDAGARLARERQRRLRAPAEMHRLFADLPRAVHAAHELTGELDFTLADLGYRFPDYPVPEGETPISHLRELTWQGARERFRPLTARAGAQLEKELALIEKLDLAGYFLIVWDIVRFCKEQRILAQGRGSAANSAVCYALSITAVDPVKMDLLFERFLSEERGEWPDIDIDLPSGDQREKVIQYVYRRYGRHGAAMTANVITYRDRMAAREAAKALGCSKSQVDRLAKGLGHWHYDLSRGDSKEMDEELTELGFDPRDRRIRIFVRLWRQLQNHPRHLGQHSGGMVLCAGRLDEIVPLEPAAMENRVIVQWDKDDCADLGLIKVDLLGLGMLNALEEAVPLIRSHEGREVDLAHLPPDDPATYEMICRADTVGVFQIESRAQMASLPRHKPYKFYDLVIQIAIIRPGPIVGGIAHPFFERRVGREEVSYPHPLLEPILRRTLGVPIFQEQILKVAMVAAGFSGGEAEDLRRAMGFKRSVERMHEIEQRLRSGMNERGITGEAQEQIVKAITSFALYGFPESHSASFALIAYASAYLKRHHPTAFFLSLLNAWPMGFYHPATLVREAQRAGSAVLPIDVNESGVRCRWQDRPADAGEPEPPGEPPPAGAIRLGLRYVKGMRHEAAERIEAEQAAKRFASIEDLAGRCRLRRNELTALASIGALPGRGRRAALWQAAQVEKPKGSLFADLTTATPSPLDEMTPMEETAADFAVASITTGPHPMEYYRRALDRRRVVPAAALPDRPAGHRVRTAGSVIVRQRPGTARGLLFLTLEDETGMSQAVVMPDQLKKHRRTIVSSSGLIVEGVLQKKDGSLSVKADRFWPIDRLERIPSHDFR
ncbi:MAG: DNA polymerase III subunit alpha [Holophagales bacterium]|nr:DNA polymerase III subunit alpha [Holophagales bacterium]MYG30295.1 DNA polymerase III subunit alpha [Holophagales bacterium]MYI80962.1 DNA polymerase III subunit alpha [Holophagales bacterium]